MSNKNEIWILSNNGSGTLAVTQKLTTTDHPGGIAVADLNNDSWPDLIVSNGYGNDISIFINQQNAAAPFLTSTPLHYATQSAAVPQGVPLGLALGRFNNDGYLDIAVANSFTNEVAVFLNDTGLGQGPKFHLAQQVAVGTAPQALVAGHFTSGANIDLAVANYGDGSNPGSVTILQGSGSGFFSLFKTLTVGVGPTAIAADFLDGNPQTDTLADLVTTNYGANTITILR